MTTAMKRAQEGIEKKAADAPCKDCKERTMTCHDDCEQYKAFMRLRDEKRRKKHAEDASIFTERFSKNLQKHRRNNL